jgi:hypothetical protein
MGEGDLLRREILGACARNPNQIKQISLSRIREFENKNCRSVGLRGSASQRNPWRYAPEILIKSNK